MKLALITGGSRGLGLSLAERLGAAGWEVHEFSRSGQGPRHHQLDLSEPAAWAGQTAALFAGLAACDWERIALVHNAGSLGALALAPDLDDAQALATLNANILGPLALIRQFLRAFAAQSAPKCLVNVSSGAARKGYPGWSLYCSAKAALENHVRALIEEEKSRPRGFSFCNFDPGVMDTAMQAVIRASNPRDFPQHQRFVDFERSGQLIDPTRVAALIHTLLEQGIQAERYSAAELLNPPSPA